MFSDKISSRTLKGPVNRKKTIQLGYIMHELGDSNDNVFITLLQYNKEIYRLLKNSARTVRSCASSALKGSSG